MIRKRYYVPKKEVFRSYDEDPSDRKPWSRGFKDYIDEDDEEDFV